MINIILVCSILEKVLQVWFIASFIIFIGLIASGVTKGFNTCPQGLLLKILNTWLYCTMFAYIALIAWAILLSRC
jgi:hypothetical protein